MLKVKIYMFKYLGGSVLMFVMYIMIYQKDKMW